MKFTKRFSLLRVQVYPILLTVLMVSLPNIHCKSNQVEKTIDSNKPYITKGIPPISDSLLNQISKYQNFRSAQFRGWLPNGSGMAILTRFAETNQIHIVKKPGGARTQVTFRTESIIDANVCPDSSKSMILFVLDSGGNEIFQIYSLDLSTSAIKLLTDGKSQNGGMVWSNRGDRFSFESTKRNGQDWDLYIQDINTGLSELVLTQGGAWSALDWSPDDKKLLVSKYISRTASFLYVLDIVTRTVIPVHDTTEVSLESAVWNRNGTGIFYTSDEGTDYRSLRYYDLQTKKEKNLTKSIPWDIRYVGTSRDRKQIVFVTNEHGYAMLYIMDSEKFSYYKVEGIPRGITGSPSFDHKGRFLGFTLSRPDRPDDVYVFEIETKKIVQWTESELGTVDSKKMIIPELIQYPTFDSIDGHARMIPCFKYLPQGAGPFPVLITIHGGPETQYWPYFSQTVQFYVNELQCAVLAPNVRGSGGYGKTYLSLDNGILRENAVKDIGSLLEWIRSCKEFDSTRIAVMGGSYGGYMALASMIHYGEKLRAGIDLYGISNYITFLENTASYHRRDLKNLLCQRIILICNEYCFFSTI